MDLSPRQIVDKLDKYIIGQDEAKKAVAIALRNRYRRSQLSAELREEITPKNIIMKGPTGVGKTEIARKALHIASEICVFTNDNIRCETVGVATEKKKTKKASSKEV